ncbi:hypothetical protein V6N12_033036 [Hibiscus sabdariffa]|uniref:Uncharacterized protein n=1 Tax=Hibiscus sabdariffa TaxID=183260 RepID=A0ABR2CET7_9ROSI
MGSYYLTGYTRNYQWPSVKEGLHHRLQQKMRAALSRYALTNRGDTIYEVGWELVGTEWKRKGKATVDNVEDVLQDVDDPVNLIRNEHLTDVAGDATSDAAANWTEAELPPHFRVMLDSFDVRLETMQSHFDGRLNEISNQQSVIQTELSEIRQHLNDKFDRLVVAVGNRSEDLSTSKAPTAQ